MMMVFEHCKEEEDDDLYDTMCSGDLDYSHKQDVGNNIRGFSVDGIMSYG